MSHMVHRIQVIYLPGVYRIIISILLDVINLGHVKSDKKIYVKLVKIVLKYHRQNMKDSKYRSQNARHQKLKINRKGLHTHSCSREEGWTTYK